MSQTDLRLHSHFDLYVWSDTTERWEKIGSAVDHWYAEEIIDALKTQTGQRYSAKYRGEYR